MPIAKKVEGYHAHLTPSTENALKNLPPFSYDQPDLEDKALPNLEAHEVNIHFNFYSKYLKFYYNSLIMVQSILDNGN